MRFLIAAAAVALFPHTLFADSAKQKARHDSLCALHLRDVSEMTDRDRARTKRSYADYRSEMPPLIARLQPLKAKSHILDFGSGESLAMAEYLGMEGDSDIQRSIRADLGDVRANVSAFSFLMDPATEADYTKRGRGKYRAITGRFAESASVTPELLMGKFGPINVVIDAWGVLAYTADPTAVLRKLAPALAKDAVIVMKTGRKEYDYQSLRRYKRKSSLYRSTVDGNPFPDWITALPGWHVVDVESTFDILIPNPRASAIPQIWLTGMDDDPDVPLPNGRHFESDRP